MLAVAVEEERAGLTDGGIPIGAALFGPDGRLLGRGNNRQFGISRVVVGEARTFHGGHDWLAGHGVGVLMLDDPACVALLTDFIAANPALCGTKTSANPDGSGRSSRLGRGDDRRGGAACGHPEWIAYYDHAHLNRDAGRALLGLALNGGSWVQAQRHLSTAIEQFPDSYARGKVLAVANLATLTMARGDPAQAVALGNEALAAVGAVRSDRVLDALKRLRRASQKHRRQAAVRELNQRVGQVLRTTTV